MIVSFPGDPVDRRTFREFCLRRLGKPVIQINVSTEQVDDCVNVALRWFQDYHNEGTERLYYRYQITDTDKTNKYITMPDNVIGAVRIFDIGTGFGAGDMFNVKYQIALNDLYTLVSTSLVPFYMTMQHLSLMEEIFIGKIPIRYNRYMNRLYLDMDWNKLNVGDWIVAECFQVIDPTVWTTMWTDRWLQKYATALIKQQWGNHLKKFKGVQMAGGISYSGQEIYDEATQEIKDIEAEVTNSYSIPCMPMIG